MSAFCRILEKNSYGNTLKHKIAKYAKITLLPLDLEFLTFITFKKEEKVKQRS